jgi:D-alanyl-lipoteichoic acid acyltransferase DltB (MBOAT superfamily)
MSFNSYTFFIFFAIVLVLHHSSFSWHTKKINLLVASYIFYAAWHPPFTILLIVCTFVDWFAGKGVAASKDTDRKRFFLLISLAINLGMLGFFKYADFLLKNFVWLLSLINIQYKPLAPDIILPLGISFFTFQSITYTFDIYRDKAKPWVSFLDFALFVSFFPKLVIGPITRARDFLPQCLNPMKIDASKMGWGFFLLFLGLFEKVIMADSLLAPVADQLFNKPGIPNTISAWTGSLAFTGQIFFDFAGYSTCAIGVSYCLGFQLPQNFNYPYAAIGFSDFWRRWHISLSTWLRDYLYISLGGNRKGKFRTYINLFLTMLIGGLWHGSSWTFCCLGWAHGLYLIIERFIKNSMPSSPLWSKLPCNSSFAFITFIAVSFAWVFFRANSFDQAFTIIQALLTITVGKPITVIEYFYILLTFSIIFIILVSHWIMRERSLQRFIENTPWWFRSMIFAGLLIAIVTCSGEDRAFIYFQF